MDQSKLADALRHWRRDPVKMVTDLFHVEQFDPWQVESLRSYQHSPRMAMKACKGPGKTAVLSWIGWHFLLCYPFGNGIATSITGDNLKDGLWKEMSRWQYESDLLKALFDVTGERIVAKEAPKRWWLSARTWPKSASTEEQANTMAGLHADNVIVLIDEVGDIPLGVVVAAEAALANADYKHRFAHLCMAGNPTRPEGPLFDACNNRDRWKVIEITGDPDDPKRSTRIDIAWARDQIKTYGRDNAYVMVNVLGKFPKTALNALVGPDEVRAAMNRKPDMLDINSKCRIVTADVARFGDDPCVKARRCGDVIYPMEEVREYTTIQGAGWVAQTAKNFFDPNDQPQRKADRIFIDDTGGYGAGWIDQLREMRDPITGVVTSFPVTGVLYSAGADDPRFYNKRTEMHWLLAEAIKQGRLTLPDDPLLLQELCAIRYYYQGDKIRLEDKDQIKKKIGRSPNRSDSAAMTYAFPVLPNVENRAAEQGAPAFMLSRALREAEGREPMEEGGRGFSPLSRETYNPLNNY